MRSSSFFLAIAAAIGVSADCDHDNTLRDLIRKADVASPFCSAYNAVIQTSTSTIVSSATNCATSPAVTHPAPVVTSPPIPTVLSVSTAKLSSGCSCLLGTSPPSTSTVTATVTSYLPPPSGCVTVNLRIEGSSTTIFEAEIVTGPENVTTPSGGTHPCNGQNLGANPNASGTPTTALQDAAKLDGFTFDGTFFAEFDDFFITSIGGVSETSTQFWGLLDNYQFTPTGGCQFEPQNGDEVLWAFDAFNAIHFLKLVGPSTASAGVPFQVTVTDGSTGSPLSGATVEGVQTDANGHANITIQSSGVVTLKASAPQSIRSNGVTVTVS